MKLNTKPVKKIRHKTIIIKLTKKIAQKYQNKHNDRRKQGSTNKQIHLFRNNNQHKKIK